MAPSLAAVSCAEASVTMINEKHRTRLEAILMRMSSSVFAAPLSLSHVRLSPLRPGRPGAIGHIERRENSHRLHPVDQHGAPLFERRDGRGSRVAVLLVDEHLAPVFDDEVAGRAALIAKERTAKIRSRVAVHRGPFSLDAVQLLEFGFASFLDFE